MKLLENFKKRLQKSKFEQKQNNQKNKTTEQKTLITKSSLGDEDLFLFI